MRRETNDVAVIVTGAVVRVRLSGTRLVVETSEDGHVWLAVLEADAGEATPIVSRVLQSLRGGARE